MIAGSWPVSNEILYVQSSVMLYELGYLVKWIKA